MFLEFPSGRRSAVAEGVDPSAKRTGDGVGQEYQIFKIKYKRYPPKKPADFQHIKD